MHAFRLHGPHPGFLHSVVPRARNRPHERHDAALPHGLADERRHISAPVVRMMEAAPLRAPVRYRHLERVVGRFRGHPGGHGPTHDLARPHVHHNRQVQPALMGPDVMSTNRALSGPSALKSRFTGSGADSPSEARFSFSGSFVQRLVTPRQPFPRIILATRFRETHSLSRFRTWKTFGEPQMQRPAS